jgi:hypothetical protein
MSAETIKAKTPEETTSVQKPKWVRATFAGLTTGDTPKATFHVPLTLRNGKTKHISFTAGVPEETLQLRLLKLAKGAEVRVCTETDWGIDSTTNVLRDFCTV